jgi:hypothetical protein
MGGKMEKAVIAVQRKPGDKAIFIEAELDAPETAADCLEALRRDYHKARIVFSGKIEATYLDREVISERRILG